MAGTDGGASGRTPRRGGWRAAATVVVAVTCLFVPVVASSQGAITFRYFYDQAGQLIRVVDSTGVSIEYVYDAVGNMLEVRRSGVAPGGLSILGLSPASGGPGAVVVVEGLGFSTELAQNGVFFNGARALVRSATASTLAVEVPIAATTGPVTVTVGGTTAASPGPFTVLALPLITRIEPRTIDVGRPPTHLTLSGVNLTGSSFSIRPELAPSAVTFGVAVFEPGGISAKVPVTLGSGRTGTFVLVAVNAAGSSDALPSDGNTLVILGGATERDSDGDGFPDGLELIYGSDPLDSSSVPDLTRRGALFTSVGAVNTAIPAGVPQMAVTRVSVVNTGLPASTIQSAISGAISVQNVMPGSTSNAADSELFRAAAGIGPAGSTDSTRPGPISLGLSVGQRLVEGQTLAVEANVSGLDGVVEATFTVNDAPWEVDSAAPFVGTFTVPSGVATLTFGVSVRRASGAVETSSPVTVAVDRDPSTTLVGRVVDRDGNPVGGATVDLLSEGLVAEYFEPGGPLGALPDLTGVMPTRSTRVTAVNLRAAGGAFGPDPFGTGMAPDYAARFVGRLVVPVAGDYRFFLGADEGARLRVGETTVANMPIASPGGFQERAGTVRLERGFVPFEVTFYQSTGNTELQLSFQPPGEPRRVIPPSSLVATGGSLRAVTDAQGRFEVRDVPTVLTGLALQLTTGGGGATTVPVNRVLLSPTVDVGDVAVEGPR